MQYPLQEQIGHPELFVGRKEEMAEFGQWLDRIPKQLSKSRAILARKKTGKTALIQRIFNQLWSANGSTIPFYYEFRERELWFPDFVENYYQSFASQCISFLERDPQPMKRIWSFDKIREYGQTHDLPQFVDDVDYLREKRKVGSYDLMWELVSRAPHTFADEQGRRALVILDEFQYINYFIFRDQACNNRYQTLAGSFHGLSESKIAPMLITGSYVGWLLNVINQYLEAGRVKIIPLSPYLTKEEGLEAVYKYAELYEVPITNETAVLLNHLCFSDPFFISCVIQSIYKNRDLTTSEGVVATLHYELSDRRAEMSKTWSEYINLAVKRINSHNAKNLLLHLSKYPDREWTHLQLKDELSLDLEPNDILKLLESLHQADLIQEGTSDIAFKGLQDGTLHLILRNRFEQEISNFEVDLKAEFLEEIRQLKKDKRSLQGQLNQLSGRVAEDQLVMELRTRGRFAPSLYFRGMEQVVEQQWIDVRSRWKFQRPDGKEMEIDVKAEAGKNAEEDKPIVLLVEVKKTKTAIGIAIIENFKEKTNTYAQLHPNQTILSAVLALGGFTKEAQHYCQTQRIGTATEISLIYK